MTKKQLISKVKSMKKDYNQYIEKECARLYDSGAINTEDYLQDFVLAKIILHVALLNCADQYAPTHTNAHDEDIKNLKHF